MAKIELKQVTLCLQSGLAGTAVIGTATPNSTDTTVDINTLSINSVILNKVPVGARFTVDTAGNDEVYEVTGIVTNATGVDEVQTLTASGATAGTWDLTIQLNGVFYVISGLSFDVDAATLQAAVDGALAGDPTYTAGDIVVATATSVDLTDTTFTYSGTSVAKSDQPDLGPDYSGLTGGTLTLTETTKGVPAGATTGLVFDPEWGAPTPANGDNITILPQEADVKVGDGNITYTINKNYEYDLDRGLLDAVREGDQAPMDITMDFSYENVRTGTGEKVTPVDIFTQEGAAAEWVSSSDDPCEPYAINVILKHQPPCGTTLGEATIFPDVRCDSIDFDIDDASISVTARSKAVKPTYLRTNDFTSL